MSVSKKTGSLAIAFAALLTSSIAYAMPHPAGGRTDVSDQPGVERAAVVKYRTGRVDPGKTTGIYRHDGRKVDNGRRG